MTTNLLEEVRGMMPGHAREHWNMTEAKASGQGQEALLKIAQEAGGEWVKLTDIPFRRVGLHFEKLMSAAQALAKKGLLDFKTEKGEGDFIRAKSKGESLEERDQAAIDKASMDKYGVKWRTTPSHHKVGVDDEGKVTKGNPNHPAVGGVSGAKQGKLFDTGKRTGPEKGWEGKPAKDRPKPEFKPELAPQTKSSPKKSSGGGGGGGGAPKQKLPKFADAKKGHLDHLKSQGWSVKDKGPDFKPLKVPHATSPNGKTRLWFKSQSVHASQTDGKAKHDMHNAHSVTDDSRTMSPQQLHAHVQKFHMEATSARTARTRLVEIRKQFEEQERLRPVHQQIAEIRNTIHQGPGWSYPTWALPPKTEFSEEQDS
jgi:hypothetical protein